MEKQGIEIRTNVTGGKITLESTSNSVYAMFLAADGLLREAVKKAEENGVELVGETRAHHEDLLSYLYGVQEVMQDFDNQLDAEGFGDREAFFKENA